jgi:hypothetical protein
VLLVRMSRNGDGGGDGNSLEVSSRWSMLLICIAKE